MSRIGLKIGPGDNGRPMSLEEFGPAKVQAGYHYELGRGIIVVSEVPAPRHLLVVHAIRRQLWAYDLANPGKVQAIAGGGECKLPIAGWDSARHPDLAVYLSEPPDVADVWEEWIPEIVVEVVSPGAEAERRDYVEKREEYLAFGVKEYWIVNQKRRQLLVLQREGDEWSETVLGPGSTYQTRRLPGFSLDCSLFLGDPDAER